MGQAADTLWMSLICGWNYTGCSQKTHLNPAFKLNKFCRVLQWRRCCSPTGGRRSRMGTGRIVSPSPPQVRYHLRTETPRNCQCQTSYRLVCDLPQRIQGALGARPPCPQDFFKIMQFLANFFWENPILEQNLGSGPPGVNTQLPPDQNPGSAPAYTGRTRI